MFMKIMLKINLEQPGTVAVFNEYDKYTYFIIILIEINLEQCYSETRHCCCFDCWGSPSQTTSLNVYPITARCGVASIIKFCTQFSCGYWPSLFRYVDKFQFNYRQRYDPRALWWRVKNSNCKTRRKLNKKYVILFLFTL